MTDSSVHGILLDWTTPSLRIPNKNKLHTYKIFDLTDHAEKTSMEIIRLLLRETHDQWFYLFCSCKIIFPIIKYFEKTEGKDSIITGDICRARFYLPFILNFLAPWYRDLACFKSSILPSHWYIFSSRYKLLLGYIYIKNISSSSPMFYIINEIFLLFVNQIRFGKEIIAVAAGRDSIRLRNLRLSSFVNYLQKNGLLNRQILLKSVRTTLYALMGHQNTNRSLQT